MNTVRPLITIGILGLVCGFLYVKINQAPIQPLPGMNESEEDEAAVQVPPLDVSPAGATADQAGEAGAKPATSASLAPEWSADSADDASADASTTADTVPDVPSIPELPGSSDSPNSDATAGGGVADAFRKIGGWLRGAGSADSVSIELPANVPTARYPDDPPATGTNESPGGVGSVTTGTESPLLGAAGGSGTNTAMPGATTSMPSGPSAGAIAGESGSAEEQAMRAMGLTPQTNASAGNMSGGRYGALPGTTTPSVGGRYGAETTNSAATGSAMAGVNTANAGMSGTGSPASTNGLPPNSSSAASFAAAWPQIQAALARNDLAEAHKLLSPWYGHPSLTPTQAQQTEKLLSQLAGTVVYSTEHRLEPPYVVRPGETLETIAQKYSVPWQLLAKINGIPAADQVQPGQQLKVVRGPFSAVVDVSGRQLVLFVDGRYAGKFGTSAAAGTQLPAGDWAVVAKSPLEVSRTEAYGAAVNTAALNKSHFVVLGKVGAAGAESGQVVIGSQQQREMPTMTYDGQTFTPGSSVTMPQLQVSPGDAEELADILSIGSRVVIRR